MWALEVIEFVPESMIGSKALAILLFAQTISISGIVHKFSSSYLWSHAFYALFKNKEYIKSPQIQW